MSLVLSYARAGSVDNYSGRDWFEGHDNCPYCKSQLEKLGSFHQDCHNLLEKDGHSLCMNCGWRNPALDIHNSSKKTEDGLNLFRPLNKTPARNCLFEVALCKTCGWWFSIENADQCNDGYAVSYSAILQSFDIASADIPLEILKAELPKNISNIHSINTKRMEDLVADILRGVYDCEVHQLGYTKDKGIDLILLHGNSPIAVQVKRRMDSDRTEGVSAIREFLGAAMLQRHNNLMYVTTARKFSKDAIDAAKESVNLGLTKSFDLLSMDKLNYLLTEANSIGNTWRTAFDDAVNKVYSIPNIPDPYKIVP